MNNYNLAALLKIREHKKNAAENNLRDASYQHALEKDKLCQIEMSLKGVIVARSKLQHDFFIKAQRSPSNKREVACHISSSLKTMGDEVELRKSLATQIEQVRCTELKLEIAKTSAIDAHRNLRAIEKHYDAWQQAMRRAEDIKEEYENDDQNGVRYILRKA